jgi:fructoselysine-6-P-deglycase FrlB-like protein
MINRQQIQEIPGALRQTLEKARPEYGALVRKVRWGDGPVYVCGTGGGAALGLAASYALEYFPGWPVVARPVEVLQSYGLSLLRPRSVLLMIAAGGEYTEAQVLAHTARERGCTVLALTHHPESALAKLADHVFIIPVDADKETPAAVVSVHAALNLLAFEAARALKRPAPPWEIMEKEFGELPDKLDWMFTQLSSVVRSASAEFAQFSRLQIVGGGFYHYPAWRAARDMRCWAGLPVEAVEATEFEHGSKPMARQGDGVLFLSGSHSKIKKLVHRAASQARQRDARVLVLTDGNDRDLAENADLAIMIPSFLEPPSSILILFMVEWLAMEAGRGTKQVG